MTCRVAVVGTGFIGPVHVEALRRAGQSVVGILGSSAKRSQAAAETLAIPRAYRSFDELLADSSVDAVHLASPNRVHCEQATAVLAAGKHLLCEKPLAMTSVESARLVTAAAQANRAAAVNYNCRYYPLVQETKARVERGEFGPLFHVTGSYTQDWLLYRTDFNWRVLADEGGPLRAVSDIGTHWFDLIQFVTGRSIVAVCADLLTVHTSRLRPEGDTLTFTTDDSSPRSRTDIPITTEDYGAILLEFEGGLRGVCHVSQVMAGRKNSLRFELAGQNQAAVWNSETSERLWLGHRTGPNHELIRDPASLSPAARATSDYPGGHNEGFSETFKHLFRAFYASIAEGTWHSKPTFPSFADGHREIALCDAILKSHQTRAWVQVI